MALPGSDGSILLTVDINTADFLTKLNSLKGFTLKASRLFLTAFSVRAISKFSLEASKMAMQQEANTKRLIQIYGKASKSLGDFIDANSRALGMSKKAAIEMSATYGNLFSVFADQETNADLTEKYLNATAVVASKTGRTTEEVMEKIRSGLFGNYRAIDDLGIFVNVKTIEMTEAFQKFANGKHWNELSGFQMQQIRAYAILEQAAKKYGTEVLNSTALIKSRFSAAYEEFKETFGRVVNIVLVPILKVLTQIMDAGTAILRTIANLSGVTITATDALESQSKAIKDSFVNQEDFNDELEKTKKLLASFDTAEILGSQNKTAAGSIGTDEELPILGETSTESNIEEKANKTKDAILSVLATIMDAAGKALMAVGLIVFFSGHIPAGVGLILAGAAAFLGGQYLEGDPNGIVDKVKEFLKEEYDKVLIGIGLLLFFGGARLWGMSLIISGAIAQGIKSVNEGEGFDKADLETKLYGIMETVSAYLFAIGVILLFFGELAKGVGLMVFGYSMLDASDGKLDEAGVKTKLEKWCSDNIGTILAVSSIALVVGIVLLFVSGVPWNVRLGLLVAGIGAITATGEVVGWDEIVAWIKNNMLMVWSALLGVGVVLFVAGIIVTFFKPLIGIVMMVGGAVLMGVSAFKAYEEDPDGVKQWIEEHEKALYTTVMAIGQVMAICGAIVVLFNVPAGLALLVGGLVAVEGASEQEVNDEDLKKWMKEQYEGFYNVIATIGVIMTVVGMVLLFLPETMAVGLKFLAVGVPLLYVGKDSGLAGATDELKNWIEEKMSTVWNVLAGLGAVSTVIGIVLLFIPGMQGVGAGLIAGGIGALSVKGIDAASDAGNALGDWLSEKVTSAHDSATKAWEREGGWDSILEMPKSLPTAGTKLNLIPSSSASYSVPKLAKGGIVPYSTLALIGEAGKEAVLPLENNTGWMDELASKIVNMTSSNNSTSTVVLEVDGIQFGRAVIEQGNRETRRVGTRLVTN